MVSIPYRDNILLLLLAWFFICRAYGFENPEKNPATDSSVVELNDKTFYTALGPNSEWIIAFTAKWCGACKRLKADYENLATSLNAQNSKVRIIRVDVDQSPALSNQFMITRLPTIYHVKNYEVRPMDEVKRDFESLQTFITKEEWKELKPYSGLFAPFSFLPSSIFTLISGFHRLIDFAKGQPTWLVAIVPLLATGVGLFYIMKAPNNQPSPSEINQKNK